MRRRPGGAWALFTSARELIYSYLSSALRFRRVGRRLLSPVSSFRALCSSLAGSRGRFAPLYCCLLARCTVSVYSSILYTCQLHCLK